MNIGDVREKENLTDREIKIVIEEHGLKKNKTRLFYTDGSKKEGKKSTGVGIVEEGKDQGYYISINRRCIVYTTEIIGIAKALQICEEENEDGDIVIFSDSKSAIQYNELNIYRNIYMMEARKRYFRIERKKGSY